MSHTTSRESYRLKRKAGREGWAESLRSLCWDILRHGLSWRADWGMYDPTLAEAVLRVAFGPNWQTVLDLVRLDGIPWQLVC